MMGLNFDAEEKAKRNDGHQFQMRGVGIANTCTGINRKFLIPVALLWVTARGPESRDLGRKLSQDYDTDWIDLLEECPLYIWRYSGLSLYTGDWDRRALDRMGMIFDDSWWGTKTRIVEGLEQIYISAFKYVGNGASVFKGMMKASQSIK